MCRCVSLITSRLKISAILISANIWQTFFGGEGVWCLNTSIACLFSSVSPWNCQCRPVGRLLIVFSPSVADIQYEFSVQGGEVPEG